jgi:glycosyltransferase involved in cell wall biosynthesis
LSKIDIILIIVFILSAFSYFIYPLFLICLLPFRHKKVEKGECYPTISLITCAYNEETLIKTKIENLLSLEYPAEKCEIIVVSDCSSDKTDAIVANFKEVKLLRSPVRSGKEVSLDLAIKEAAGEILVFSDVATGIQKDALLKLVRNFNDSSVGVVSSFDKIISQNGVAVGEGLYVKYEMFVRSLESAVNGLFGVSGSFFAARKDICTNWSADMASDFNVSVNAIKKGYRSIIDSEVIGLYSDLKSSGSEFPRKVRTVIAGITVFLRTLDLLNIFKYGLYSIQIFGHKLMRWLSPFFLIALYAASVWGTISGSVYYLVFLLAQTVFYGLGIVGMVNKNLLKVKYIKLSYYFTEVNAAIIVAWYKYLTGTRIKTWEPSKRQNVRVS